MRVLFLFILLYSSIHLLSAQEDFVISGSVFDNRTKHPIENSSISIEGSSFSVKTNSAGAFTLKVDLSGEVILNLTAIEYELKRIPVVLEGFGVNIGTI